MNNKEKNTFNCITEHSIRSDIDKEENRFEKL